MFVYDDVVYESVVLVDVFVVYCVFEFSVGLNTIKKYIHKETMPFCMPNCSVILLQRCTRK